MLVQVNPHQLQRVLAFLEDEEQELEDRIDDYDDGNLREDVDGLARDLHRFAELNPGFDEEES